TLTTYWPHGLTRTADRPRTTTAAGGRPHLGLDRRGRSQHPPGGSPELDRLAPLAHRARDRRAGGPRVGPGAGLDSGLGGSDGTALRPRRFGAGPHRRAGPRRG